MATEAGLAERENKKITERAKKLLTEIGLLMEGCPVTINRGVRRTAFRMFRRVIVVTLSVTMFSFQLHPAIAIALTMRVR